MLLLIAPLQVFQSKFDIIAPVWFELKEVNENEVTLTGTVRVVDSLACLVLPGILSDSASAHIFKGGHNVDLPWIEAVRARHTTAKCSVTKSIEVDLELDDLDDIGSTAATTTGKSSCVDRTESEHRTLIVPRVIFYIQQVSTQSVRLLLCPFV